MEDFRKYTKRVPTCTAHRKKKQQQKTPQPLLTPVPL